MSQSAHTQAAATHNKQLAETDKTLFGFWVYLMTDCILFASLFAAYAVLQTGTAGGPSGKELFSLPYVLLETFLLLTSSLTAGLGVLAARSRNLPAVKQWFWITFMLGAGFLLLELVEFQHLVAEGHSWRESGFLSAFFTLVGTHGLHITAGLLWMGVLLARLGRSGLNHSAVKRLTLLSLFWHFLDIIWIAIFTVVYLLGVL